MYSADALANEIGKAAARSSFHSISVGGRDPLANSEYICAAFATRSKSLPVMLDCDGQRPDGIALLRQVLTLVQVTIEGSALSDGPHVDCAIQSLRAAADSGLQHALVLSADERTSDPVLLRIVEQAHAASAQTMMVVHPGPGSPVDRDRRWTTVIERSAAVHGDIRFALPIPSPTGMR
jgi:hypothetical protein